MAKHVFVVFTEAQPGQEAAFNTWYDSRHIPDVLSVPGFVAAQRFRVQPPAGQTGGPQRYLALYEMETDDVGATMAELMARAGGAAMPLSEAMNGAAIQTFLADALGPKVSAEPAAA
ncbi:MAG: hypothetical protein JWQ97_1452 [Phenylobacterium sp.]|nr:hypothetical protein [Phenylobacterium sp.]